MKTLQKRVLSLALMTIIAAPMLAQNEFFGDETPNVVQLAAVEVEFADQATSQNMVDAVAFAGSDEAKARGTGVAGQFVYDTVSWDEQMEAMPAQDVLTRAKQAMASAREAIKNFNWRENPMVRANQIAAWAKKNPLQAVGAFVAVAATTYGLYKAVRYLTSKKKQNDE